MVWCDMTRLFGLETEYGITIDGVDRVDVVEESMQLIRCYQHFVPLWDYRLENPRRDDRGFEVKNLLNDADEKVHLQQDRKRKIPFVELKSDLIIYNGSRFYNDHTHPEYSTGECVSLFELVAQDKAGSALSIFARSGGRRCWIRALCGCIRIIRILKGIAMGVTRII